MKNHVKKYKLMATAVCMLSGFTVFKSSADWPPVVTPNTASFGINGICTLQGNTSIATGSSAITVSVTDNSQIQSANYNLDLVDAAGHGIIFNLTNSYLSFVQTTPSGQNPSQCDISLINSTGTGNVTFNITSGQKLKFIPIIS
jgi:hypothetical protein